MFDCGIHPALQGENSLPYLSSEDLDTVDVALITHFHLDHCAAVPYLLQKTVFKVSKVFRQVELRCAATAMWFVCIRRGVWGVVHWTQ